MMKIIEKRLQIAVAVLLMVAAQLSGFVLPAEAAGAKEPIVALGADLSAEQRAIVLDYMSLTEADLEKYTVITVTNEQEHQYLDAYLDPGVIGTRSLSSVLVSPLSKGSGLDITTYNISYCTVSMYRNALLTAGIEDAEVIVAAPSSISGTAALIGAVKAYEEMTGETVGENVLQTATNELVVTGELGDLLGDSEEASDLIAHIKQQILESGAETEEEIAAVIRDVAEKYGVVLSDESFNRILELMSKISQLDLDVEALAEQAKDAYDKIKDMGLEIDTRKVGNFFVNLLNAIINFIKKLFGLG